MNHYSIFVGKPSRKALLRRTLCVDIYKWACWLIQSDRRRVKKCRYTDTTCISSPSDVPQPNPPRSSGGGPGSAKDAGYPPWTAQRVAKALQRYDIKYGDTTAFLAVGAGNGNGNGNGCGVCEGWSEGLGRGVMATTGRRFGFCCAGSFGVSSR